MASRNELAVRARNVGLDPNTYTNDSKLEQKVLWLEKNGTAFAGTAATGTITSNGTNASDGDTVTIGNTTYTFKTTLGSAQATTTLTSTGTIPADGDSISIESQNYTFRTTLTNGGTSPYEVFINGSAANALANLKKALNASGVAGTDYGQQTLAHPQVNAGTLTGTTLVILADQYGTAANAYLTTVVTGATLSFTGTNLAGGGASVANQVHIGAASTNTLTNLASAINGTGTPGTDYDSSTAPNLAISGSAASNVLTLTAKDFNVTNTGVGLAKTAATLTLSGANLTGGVDKIVAADTTTYNGSPGLSGDKDI